MMRTVNKGKIPIYPGRLKVIFTGDLREVDDKYNLPSHENSDAMVFVKDGIYYAVFEVGEVTPGLIAHECIHLYSYIASHNGVLLSRGNDEPQAYYVQWLINRVFESVPVGGSWKEGTVKLFKQWAK